MKRHLICIDKTKPSYTILNTQVNKISSHKPKFEAVWDSQKAVASKFYFQMSHMERANWNASEIPHIKKKKITVQAERLNNSKNVAESIAGMLPATRPIYLAGFV